MNRSHQRGQASLELVGAIPIILVAVMVVLQLAAFVRGAMLVREDVRAQALRASGSGTITVVARRRVASLIPGLGPFTITARATTVAR